MDLDPKLLPIVVEEKPAEVWKTTLSVPLDQVVAEVRRAHQQGCITQGVRADAWRLRLLYDLLRDWYSAAFSRSFSFDFEPVLAEVVRQAKVHALNQVILEQDMCEEPAEDLRAMRSLLMEMGWLGLGALEPGPTMPEGSQLVAGRGQKAGEPQRNADLPRDLPQDGRGVLGDRPAGLHLRGDDDGP